jgi:tetratricopeptide (TPR) repeat protein
VAAARQVIDFYEVNPDPERIAYAHNTFVQTYLEQGPLGTLGMLLVPVIAALAVLSARRALSTSVRDGLAPERRALMLSSLALLVGLEVHGITDQVLTTNGGTALLFLALAGVLGATRPDLQRQLASWSIRLTVGGGVLILILALGMLLTSGGRARVLLNLGNLELNRALLGQAAPDRPALSSAASLLAAAVDQDATQPAAWRQLARARLGTDEITAAVDALQHAASRPDLDAFEMLQVAHVYRDLGFGQEAYAWATRAYAAWGRRPPDAVEVAYQRATLVLDPQGVLLTLTDQAEAALRAGRYAEAAALLRQALPLAPDNVYLQSRIAFAERLQAREQRSVPEQLPRT